MLDALNQLNEQTFQRLGDPETQTRIAQYEMAYRMQTSVPDLMDMSTESEATYDLYGPDSKKPGEAPGGTNALNGAIDPVDWSIEISSSRPSTGSTASRLAFS